MLVSCGRAAVHVRRLWVEFRKCDCIRLVSQAADLTDESSLLAFRLAGLDPCFNDYFRIKRSGRDMLLYDTLQ